MLKKIKKDSVRKIKNSSKVASLKKIKFKNILNSITVFWDRLKKLFKRKDFYIPFTVLVISFIVFIFTIYYENRPPKIKKIDPDVALPESVLEIKGNNFGDNYLGAYVSFASTRVDTLNYISWSNKKIVLKIPKDVMSGMVYVVTRVGVSNGVLFTNINHIPKFGSENFSYNKPVIFNEKIDVVLGKKVTISGKFLGSSKEDCRILLYYKNSFVSVVDKKDILSWTPSKIEFLFFDEKNINSLRVDTPVDLSEEVEILFKQLNGRKDRQSSEDYRYSFLLNIKNLSKTPSDFFVWVPVPKNSFRQKVSSGDDFVLFSKRNISSNSYFKVKKSFSIKSYNMHWSFANKVFYSDYFNSGSSKNFGFVKDDVTLFKRGDLALDDFVERVSKKIVEKLEPSDFDVEDKKGANSYEYAQLFNEVLSSVGIFSRVVSGAYIFEGENRIHYWNEYFYIGVGWISVDNFNRDFVGEKDSFMASYYYRNCLSSKYIKFSDLEKSMPKKFAGNNIFSKEYFYSMQNFIVESSSEIVDNTIENMDISFVLKN